MSSKSFVVTLALGTILGGCDYSGDFLFPETSEQAPAIYELRMPDGSELVPVDVASTEDVVANAIYAEVGAPTSAAKGGVTFTFLGTGDDVCVFVDPEAVYWNQAIQPRLDDDSRPWSFPDNVFDDGDLDLSGGLSVYYTGSANEIGDFRVNYADSLGNPVEVSLSVCQNTGYDNIPNAHSGRGTPEFCTISTTEPGVQYTIVLETFSTPLDDDRLSFGLLLANGDCQGVLAATAAGDSVAAQECVIPGEAIRPESQGPWFGFDAVRDLVWTTAGGSYLDFETEFCLQDSRLDRWCEDELAAVLEDGGDCDYMGDGSGTEHCFCGDVTNTPDPGAI